MALDRREFIGLGAAAMASKLLASPSLGPASKPYGGNIRAIAFDGFPIIDPRPIALGAEELFPGKGGLLMETWRTRQFEYTWLRTLGGRYSDFWQVTEDALLYAAAALKLELRPDQRDQLLGTYLKLKAWPEVEATLKTLREAGLRMAFLSNFTAQMLDAAVKNSRLEAYFEPHLSTDRVRAFKPDVRAYRMGVEAFKLRREQIAFVASAGWDAAGAAWFGYPTLWVNRQGSAAEHLDTPSIATGNSLADLASFVRPAGHA